MYVTQIQFSMFNNCSTTIQDVGLSGTSQRLKNKHEFVQALFFFISASRHIKISYVTLFKKHYLWKLLKRRVNCQTHSERLETS